MAKKVEKLIELKFKKVGKNLVGIIDGNKIVKKDISDKDLKSIQTKILIYNKTNSEAKKKEILKAMENEIIKEKETKAITKKGITKAIKKESKKAPKKLKEQDPEKDLIQEVREAYGKGDLTDEQIKSLQDLLKKEEAKKEAKKEETRTESNSNRGREAYR